MRILSLLYHEVTNQPESSGFQRKKALAYKHTYSEFARHMVLFERYLESITTIKNLKHDSDNILLTFDDGGLSNLYIADKLEGLGLRGHFFIPTEFIGKKHFLSEGQIIDLHKRGHIIGSHSHSHPNVFKSQDENQMIEEWQKSASILESILGSPVESCSIPGGDGSKLSYATAESVGYRYIFNSEPKVKPIEIGKSLILGRVSLKKGDSINKVRRLLDFHGLLREQLIRFTKVSIKTLLYPLYIKIHNARKHVE
ncbi:MAG: peptidoglycan/xylan/chitin deacetylase (PgdA/CDA1 family) [Algoriphagus sp.]|jgi:peptidoglycan/xylan/chitin deacetylase (PgdA/CDA1 family)